MLLTMAWVISVERSRQLKNDSGETVYIINYFVKNSNGFPKQLAEHYFNTFCSYWWSHLLNLTTLIHHLPNTNVAFCPVDDARILNSGMEWRLLIIISRESKWGTLKSTGNPRCAVPAESHSICTDRRWLDPAAGLQVSPTSDTCQSVAILMNRRHSERAYTQWSQF